MKTKTSILTAVVALAGASAMAQVYSQNVVGYVNVTVPTGFSMIANQLQATNHTIASLMPTVPDGTTVYKWTGTTFASYVFDGLDNAWTPNGTATLAPGEGVFIRNSSGSPFTVTFVGEVLQGSQTNSLPAGFSIVSSKVPQGTNVNALGFPAVDGATIYKYVNNGSGGGAYVSSTYDGLDGAWLPTTPNLAVGESFWARMPSSAAWTRTFNVN